MSKPEQKNDTSTIKDGEYHPAADSAMAWLKGYMVAYTAEWLKFKESLASTALSGNRQSEICLGTIDRMARGEPVGDRYVLGLAWTLMRVHNQSEMEDIEKRRVDI